jgi:hypothetical protein
MPTTSTRAKRVISDTAAKSRTGSKGMFGMV